MARKTGTCECCLLNRPIEGHHKVPLNYGGRQDGDLAYICASCHDIVHTEAEHYTKHGNSTSVLINAVGTVRGINLAKLAAIIVKAKIAYQSGEIESAGEQRLMTQISWDSEDERLMAHAVKTSLGFKSLERAIKHVVREAYIKTLEN